MNAVNVRLILRQESSEKSLISYVKQPRPADMRGSKMVIIESNAFPFEQ